MIVRAGCLIPGVLVLLSGCARGTRFRPALENNPLPRRAFPTGGLSSLPPSAKLPAQPSLSDYLAYAALNNASLQSAFNGWKASLEKVPQVKAMPDPRFTYRYYIEEVETRVGPQRSSLQLAQTFPWFGKLRLRGGAAAEAAEAARQQYENRKLAVFYQVKETYYDYYYLARAVAVTDENLRLLQYLEGVVRARYRAGVAEHPDLLRLQVELGKLEDHLRTLTEMRQPIMSRLAAVLNLPADQELPWPDEVEPGKSLPGDQQLVIWANESNPYLKTLDAEIARRKKRVALAKKDYFPDVTLGLTWIETGDRVGAVRPGDSGKDPLVAMISVNLPIWWDKLKAGVREARYRYIAAMKRKVDETNSLAARVTLAAYYYRDAQRKMDLYERVLIPRASESLKVTEAAFRAGKAGFSDLIDAQRILLEFQLTYERSLADRAERLAKLEMLVGRELPS